MHWKGKKTSLSLSFNPIVSSLPSIIVFTILSIIATVSNQFSGKSTSAQFGDSLTRLREAHQAPITKPIPKAGHATSSHTGNSFQATTPIMIITAPKKPVSTNSF